MLMLSMGGREYAGALGGRVCWWLLEEEYADCFRRKSMLIL